VSGRGDEWRRFRCALAGSIACALALAPGSALAAPTGSISGTVTDEATASPIAGVPICAVYERFGEEGEERYCAQSNVFGEYEIADLPSHEYSVEFLPGTAGLNYLFEAWNDERTWVAADPVAVEGGPVHGIDAELAEGGELRGLVTNALTGAPVPEVEVCAEPEHWEVEEGCALTDADGRYTIYGLGTDEYLVSFYAPESLELLWQYWNGEPGILAADPVAVAAGGATDHVDARMVPGARISGTVTDAASHAPLDNVSACVEPTDEGSYVGRCGTSDATGRYTIRFVPAGLYYIRFSLESELNVGARYTGNICRRKPLAVPAVAGQETSGIDVELLRREELPFCPIEVEPEKPKPPLLEVRRVKPRRDGKIAVALTTRSSGTLSFYARTKLQRRPRPTTIVRKKIVVGAGPKTVLLTPNRFGRRLLHTRGRIGARLSVDLLTHQGTSASLSRRIAFRLGRGR
jgi:Carboxypeptidase regulatory-like domain